MSTFIGIDRNGGRGSYPNGAKGRNGALTGVAGVRTAPNGRATPGVRTGRLDLLVPHLIRGQLLRPGFVRMSFRLGVARQMPTWAKLQFLNHGVARADLDRILGRVTSLTSWADAWEELAREKEQAAREAEARGDRRAAGASWLSASAAYNFAQYVIFMDTRRKHELHDACVRAYQSGAPSFDPPAQRFEVMFRRKHMVGTLRVPRSATGPVPVVVMFNGTNGVKEELHWWSDAFLAHGIACLAFDGPGIGQTFHRLSMVGDPRAMGVAILNQIETHPDLDAGAVAFVGQSLGGQIVIRMAAHDPRIKAVAALSPPFSVEVYWRVTLAGMRRELAALYGIEEREMEKVIDRITLARELPALNCPLLLTSGGQDHITPYEEARRIFDEAHCEREFLYYPRGAHDCFNMMSDLRPRLAAWIERKLEPHRGRTPQRRAWEGDYDPAWSAAEAVDPDFADALTGETPRREWHEAIEPGMPVRFEWPWHRARCEAIEVVHETRAAENGHSTAFAGSRIHPAL